MLNSITTREHHDGWYVYDAYGPLDGPFTKAEAVEVAAALEVPARQAQARIDALTMDMGAL